jgi:TIR domain/inactive STAND
VSSHTIKAVYLLGEFTATIALILNKALTAMPAEVFISYKLRDEATADVVCAALEEAGVLCWLAPRNVPLVADYKVVIPEAISAARVLLLIFSAAANNSRHVLAEVQMAFNKSIPIVPFRIEDFRPTGGMEYLLSHSQWLDAFSPTPAQPQHIRRLVTDICRHLDRLPKPSRLEWLARPTTTPNYGALVYKFCDRTSQENKFIEYFNKYRKEQPGRPQVYFIHGEDGECHDSFVERLRYGPIKEIAEKTWGEQNGVVIYKRPDWPHEGEPADFEQDLKVNLFKEFNPDSAGGEMSAPALGELAADLRCPLVVIQHNIHARLWGARTRWQIEWYLRYWAELRANMGYPQFLIFLSVIYPAADTAKGKTRAWWKPWASAAVGGYSKSQVQTELADVVNGSSVCPCFLLKELTPPKQFEVQDWFSRYHIYDEQTQREKLAELFPAHVEQLSMSQVQHALKKIHEQFVRERGHF